jgi:hypothetical protein
VPFQLPRPNHSFQAARRAQARPATGFPRQVRRHWPRTLCPHRWASGRSTSLGRATCRSRAPCEGLAGKAPTSVMPRRWCGARFKRAYQLGASRLSRFAKLNARFFRFYTGFPCASFRARLSAWLRAAQSGTRPSSLLQPECPHILTYSPLATPFFSHCCKTMDLKLPVFLSLRNLPQGGWLSDFESLLPRASAAARSRKPLCYDAHRSRPPVGHQSPPRTPENQ